MSVFGDHLSMTWRVTGCHGRIKQRWCLVILLGITMVIGGTVGLDGFTKTGGRQPQQEAGDLHQLLAKDQVYHQGYPKALGWLAQFICGAQHGETINLVRKVSSDNFEFLLKFSTLIFEEIWRNKIWVTMSSFWQTCHSTKAPFIHHWTKTRWHHMGSV